MVIFAYGSAEELLKEVKRLRKEKTQGKGITWQESMSSQIKTFEGN